MSARRSLLLVPLFSACELLSSAGGVAAIPVAPTLALDESALVAAPTAREIAAWYCPQIHGDPITRALCQSTIGPVPPQHRMQFHFELRYLIDNPNEIPIPTTEILAALEVFKGREIMELGAVCAVLCNEGDTACTGAPGENSCKADGNEITSFEDVLTKSLPNLLVLTLDAAINGDLDNLAKRLIPAGAKNFEVRVRFSLGVDAMLEILGKTVDQLVDDALSNRPLELEIPYSVRGTIWFDVPIIGRVALGYGAFEDVWRVGVDGIVDAASP